MSVLDRSSLEASPLADLHAIASELSIDGYRRLRKAELISAILDRQGGADSGDSIADAEADTEPAAEADTEPPAEADTEPPAEADTEPPAEADTEPVAEADTVAPAAGDGDSDDSEDGEEERPGSRRRRGRRGGRGRGAGRAAEAEESAPATPEKDEAVEETAEETDSDDGDQLVEGVVELLAGGSGFVRVEPPDPSDDDVYISSAQVKRCELVSGDRVTGPKRAPRRSERFASMIRIEAINGRPASELADSIRFDDLPAAFPEERLKIGSDDPTLKAIEWLTPFGKGSRVMIAGPARSGKTEALRRLAEAFAAREDLVMTVVLARVRPEEITEWTRGPVVPTAAVGLAASEDAQNGAVEPVIDQARRLAARGSDAVVLIDGLDGCSPAIARKAMASARNIVDGGSLTVIATAAAPVGGETTVIALDEAMASVGRFPALDLIASGTMRPELLVGTAGAEAIARTRLEASDETGDDE
jgi:transcription termination factor Rho